MKKATSRKSSALHLFDAFGVELEYMIVDRSSVDVRPIADEVFREVSGEQTSDYHNGGIAWSNELVCHVLELKNNPPTVLQPELAEEFYTNIQTVNRILEKKGACLMGGGAHPLMDPHKETRIWPWDSNEIYDLYNSIFDCRGHGWSNLQSVHLNLPFCGDKEFAALHAAVRLILPILPGLCASSPLLDGKVTGFRDSRLEVYRKNQKKIPSIAGSVIPEAVFSEADYEKEIFMPMMQDIAPYDPEEIMEKYFLNSRGAIARFDRGSIEIRVMDIQEVPKNDVAITSFLSVVLKALVMEKWAPFSAQSRWGHEVLADLFLRVVKSAETTEIDSPEYLRLFGMEAGQTTVQELWRHLFTILRQEIPKEFHSSLELILNEGTLSSRILKSLGAEPGEQAIRNLYKKLSESLSTAKPFTV